MKSCYIPPVSLFMEGDSVMKKNLLLLFSGVVMILTGCVSSDRMARMSGGVFDEYSAPPSYRLRSEKFMKKTPSADSIKRANTQQVAGLNDTLVNIWPFFFRNNAYWSVLWPFIDCDDYGFAVRPFFVKDGDEHSVLFPLAAWNPENKDGWVANFVWTKSNGFGFIPLTWQDTANEKKGWFYYTPLLIHNYDEIPLSRNKLARKDHFTEFMLAFWGKNRKAMTGEYDWLYRWWNRNNIGKNPSLAYHFAKIGKSAPKNLVELNNVRDEIFKTLPVKEGYSYGFFPLFGYSKEPNGNTEFNFLLLNGISKSERKFSWGFFAPLAFYENNELSKTYLWGSAKKEFFSFPLLTKITTTKRYKNEGAVATLRKIDSLNTSRYNQNLPRIKELLKELDPKLELPKSVVDHATLNLFLDDWKKTQNFPVKESYSGGCLPLFLYNIDGKTRSYIYPALLTQYKTNPNRTNFWSLPILTFVNQTKDSSYVRVAPPFVYMQSSERNSAAHTKLIHSEKTKTASKWNVVEEEDRYVACGLFYQGKIAFHVAKKEYKSEDLEFLRKTILWISNEKRSIKESWNSYEQENKRIAAWKTKDKIDYYEKCIRIEEQKQRAEKLRKREREVAAKWSLVKSTAARIKFAIDETEVATRDASVKAVNRLLADFTELRWKEDIGNGIFFRKEKFYNGDYNWRLFWFLAGGEKVGTKENTNVLHLLYRYRRDGNRSETLFFPFVSIVKDGKDRKVSFLWRVFQLKEEKGKIGGYFLFIPF